MTVGYLAEAVASEELLERVMAKATEMSRFADSGFAPTKQRVRSTLAEVLWSNLDADIDSITMPRA